MKRTAIVSLFLLAVLNLFAVQVDRKWIEENYEKTEVMIPMRDGVRLFAAVYTPKQSDGKSPFLMRRTPYGCAKGKSWEGSLWREWRRYAEEKYIFVCQDVRGKGLSEGTFVDIRPMLAGKHGKKEIDEATDTYDTVEWLLGHIRNNNGNVGLIGSSYPGFYAIQGALCGHKAIKAAVPEAPVYSWFRGDDFHRNGAFYVRDAFGFMNRHCRPRLAVGKDAPVPKYIHTDEYSFFLGKSIKDLSALFKGEVPFWTDMCNHPDEDEWWQARDYTRRLYDVKPAIMVVGGLWDAEDYYGACQLYYSLMRNSPSADVRLALGPWQHGGWNNSGKNALGNYSFGEQNQALFYQEKIEFPFLHHYLKDKSVPLSETDKAMVFFTGENKWHGFKEWSSKDMPAKSYYLSEGGVLCETPPDKASSCSSYISDPLHPVPFMEGIQYGRPADYMTADQRFAERRPDVLTFKTAPLKENVTLAGDVQVNLSVALSTTDADFVVKVIDIYPDNYGETAKTGTKTMDGYALPVRMEIFRGRYREGFSRGVPFKKGEITRVPFTMQGIAHTFRKGHRIAVQVQSSWFPLADMNPQQFVNIYQCDIKDFVKSEISVFHQKNALSSVTMHIFK